MRVALALLSWCVLVLPAAAAAPPNVLVLMAEDLGPRIGAFGDPLARTPSIDRLAADGVRYPNTFTTAGVCAPSRAAFVTGMHQNALGAGHMRTSTSVTGAYLAVPPPEVKAFPELLRAAGYYTFTDRKLDYQFSGITAGTGPFTIWDAEGAEAHYRDRAPGQPFFGLVNLQITHESAGFSSAFLEAHGDARGAAVARAAERARDRLAQRTPPAAVIVPPYYPDRPEVRRELATRYDNVALMDAEVDEWLKALQAEGLLDHTIVIWTTDHGDALPRAKRELFDSGIRVPLVIRWPAALRPPGLDPGSEDRRLVSFVDLAPTILGFAGIQPPAFVHGRDLFDPAASTRDYVYAARDRMDEQVDRVRAVRDARFKYLRYDHPGTPGAHPIEYRERQATMHTLWAAYAADTLDAAQRRWFEPRPRESLYDVAADPHEIHDLAGDPAHAATLERLRAALERWQQQVPDAGALDEARLRTQLWPDGKQPLTPTPSVSVSGGMLEARAADGASIGYRRGADAWRLYTAPVRAEAGVEFTFKAVRYGWAESTPVRIAGPAER